MKRNIKHFAPLPGIYKEPCTKQKIIPDFIFFLVVTAVPSSFYALIDQDIFYRPGFFDLNLLFFLSSLIYLIYYFKHIPAITCLPGGKSFLVLCIFLVFHLCYSYFYLEIPVREIITVFRKNFFWPIATLGLLLYASTMNRSRMARFFYWLLLVTLFQGLLYIFSNLTGIDLFGARVKEALLFEGEILLQNVFAIPHYLFALFVFYFLTSLTDKTCKKYLVWVSALVVVVLSSIRSMLLVYLFYICCLLIFGKMARMKLRISKLIKQALFLLVTIGVLLFVFPTHVNNFAHKFGLEKNWGGNTLATLDTGTYNLRIGLIEDAFERTRNQNILFGNGYIREGVIGSYDFVLGGDTLIAPVLFTEGFLGLIIRWMPILVIMFTCFKFLARPKGEYKLYYLVILVLILPEFVNIVQTEIFTNYQKLFFIFMLLQLMIKNDVSRVNKGNVIKDNYCNGLI